MAKKNKGFKIKQYPVPREKFLVVVNPWGVYDNFSQSDFNHIGAWFEIMLRDEYPNTRLRAIFYQRTHKTIIVELPREVQDIEQYLGAHHHSKFHRKMPVPTEVSCIYEYKYATFGDPSDKNFSIGNAMYDLIPPDFPIVYPYPLSSPAPPPPVQVPYARAVPSEVNAKLAERHQPRAPPPPNAAQAGVAASTSNGSDISMRAYDRNTSASTSSRPTSIPQEHDETPSQSRSPTISVKGKAKDVDPSLPNDLLHGFTQYVSPSHLKPIAKDTLREDSLPVQVKKMDPYEEDEMMQNFLQSGSPDEDDEAHNLLASIIPVVKNEGELLPSGQDFDPYYKPSSELLDAVNSLPEELINGGAELSDEEELKPFIKPEPVEAELPVYEPSNALKAALSSLSSEHLYPETPEVHIKPEPTETEDLGRIKQEPSSSTSFGRPNDDRQVSRSSTHHSDQALRPFSAKYESSPSQDPGRTVKMTPGIFSSEYTPRISSETGIPEIEPSLSRALIPNNAYTPQRSLARISTPQAKRDIAEVSQDEAHVSPKRIKVEYHDEER